MVVDGLRWCCCVEGIGGGLANPTRHSDASTGRFGTRLRRLPGRPGVASSAGHGTGRERIAPGPAAARRSRLRVCGPAAGQPRSVALGSSPNRSA
ncbi:hypothetical protein ACFSM7_08200 [Clavibacter michiganensis subsp. tessellarius]|uniref:hypothetical protein n=1 Tax=Clavibacter tessellarius TaxID=31965 RepID=UPI003633A06B